MTDCLTTRDNKTLHSILSKYDDIKLVHLFGSRAKGTARPGSDIDLVIMNKGVGNETIRKLKGDLDESSLPYLVDVINYSTIDNEDLMEHINRVGIEFYKRHKDL